MEKIRVAISSYGMSGRVFHGPLLKVLPEFEVVAILERTKSESKSIYPEAAIVRTFDKLISRSDVDLVIVNTPDHLHFSMAKAALLAGKHVVVEKPFTKSSAEAKELISIARERELTLSVYQNRRYDGGYLTVKKVIQEGLIGDICEFNANFARFRNYIVPNTWKEQGDDKTGTLYNLGSHTVDQSLDLFGKPDAVTAQLETRRKGGKIVDYFDIRLHYKNHDSILRSSYLVRETSPSYIVHGDMGSFIKEKDDPQERMLSGGMLPNNPLYGIEEESDWGTLNTEIGGLHFRGKIETIKGDYSKYYKNIADVILRSAELEVKPEEAALTIEILEACIESNLKRATIPLTTSL